MRIARERYRQKLIKSSQNGQIKIITGIWRCGKSYLLNELFREYLLKDGVLEEQIIALTLDSDIHIKYRNPNKLRANQEVLDDLLNFVVSSIGSLTNPSRLSKTFESVKHVKIKNSIYRLRNFSFRHH